MEDFNIHITIYNKSGSCLSKRLAELYIMLKKS